MAKCNKQADLCHSAKGQLSCIFWLGVEVNLSLDVPNLAGQNINSIFRLERGNFVMMSIKRCFYIGEVLNIYKQVVSSCYGSVDNATAASSLSYLALRVYLLLQVQSVHKLGS